MTPQTLFALGFVLIFLDAATDYFTTPRLAALLRWDDNPTSRLTRNMRNCLPFSLALQSFLNCYAYFKGSPGALVLLLILIAANQAYTLYLFKTAPAK